MTIIMTITIYHQHHLIIIIIIIIILIHSSELVYHVCAFVEWLRCYAVLCCA